MADLTRRQRDILQFLYDFAQEYGRIPTGAEIAREFLFNQHQTGYQYLRKFLKKGYLERSSTRQTRPIPLRFTGKAMKILALELPILGHIPAGPLEAVLQQLPVHIRSVEDLLPMSRKGDVLIRVACDAMSGDNIHPGQLALIRPGLSINDGDICAVWIEDEGGIFARVYDLGNRFRLVFSNPREHERIIPPERLTIKGVLVAAIEINPMRRSL